MQFKITERSIPSKFIKIFIFLKTTQLVVKLVNSFKKQFFCSAKTFKTVSGKRN